MSMTVNSNVASLSVQKNLNKASDSLATTMQRLSSGLKINSAKDDAAGLQIANRLTSQITGLNTAVKNANDGISIAQTAEGALQESTNILQRMRELSLQAANGSNSDEDRNSLNQEFGALSKELTRIANTTTFGTGMKLLDGSAGTLSFQVGANANENISFSLSKMDANSLKSVSDNATVTGSTFPNSVRTASSSIAAQASVSGTDVSGNDGSAKFTDLSINGQTITLSDLDNDKQSEAAQRINDANIGVTASYDSTSGELTLTSSKDLKIDAANTGLGLSAATTKAQFGAASSAGDYKDISINGKTVTLTTAASAGDVVSAINSTAGVGVTASLDDNGKLVLTSSSGDDIKLADGTAGDGSLALLGLDSAKSTLTSGALAKDTSFSINGNEIKLSKGDDIDAVAKKINGAGLGVTAEVANGKLVLNSYGNSITLADGGDNADNGGLAAIGLTKGTTSTTTTHVQGADLSAFTSTNPTAAGKISINKVDIDVGSKDAQGVLDAINAVKDQTGVTAALDANGKLVLNSNQDIVVAAPSSGTDGSAQLGLTAGTTIADETSVAQLDIKTASDAQKSIQVIDSALKQIDSQRAELGAVQNRFDSTISNLQSISENATSARSRVQDTDFAAETAEMTKQQTLQQASTAVLAQANQLPSAVLKLLQ
ncbi:flagellin [Pseudomonas citronellolis]|uniref:flagellin N-terminal helical domain-containing protein n=1 Tax=Pseudomonas citronellolis TaxID=53408 RepID=UPI00248DD704|nr:flagellin [Pseudomonas citronellolis]